MCVHEHMNTFAFRIFQRACYYELRQFGHEKYHNIFGKNQYLSIVIDR